MLGTIYYVADVSVPEGQAATFRVFGNALALQSYGFTVRVVGHPNSARSRARAGEPEGIYRGVPYYAFDDHSPRNATRWKRVWRYLMGGMRAASWLKQYGAADARAIVLAGGYSRYLTCLIPLARRWRIPLVVDVVEWYEASHLRGGRLSPLVWDVELSLRKLIPKAGNVIAVSTFLERYFLDRGVASLRVPPLVDMGDAKWASVARRETGGRLRLAFVGNAGRKDMLVSAIRGMAALGDESSNWELNVVGPMQEEVARNLGKEAELLNRLKGCLHFKGMVSHTDALSLLGDADFSILLRQDRRFAHAGFPTKLVESLSKGVPVICNLTSDIGRYVRDGLEGLVVSDCSAESFAAGLRRAVQLSHEQRTIMRENARRMAEARFDYRKWAQPLGEFLQHSIEKHQGPKR